jgi:pentatricopeptide repeat protein
MIIECILCSPRKYIGSIHPIEDTCVVSGFCLDHSIEEMERCIKKMQEKEKMLKGEKP